MPVTIPEALCENLSFLSICITADSHKELFAEPFEGDARMSDGSWVHLITGRISEDEEKAVKAHYHVDLKRSFKRTDKDPASHTIEQLQPIFDLGIDLTDEDAAIKSVFVVETNVLPQGGIIRPFLGLAVNAKTSSLGVRGMQFDLTEEGADTLSWRRMPNSPNVEVRFGSRLNLVVDDNLIVNAMARHADVFRRLVLEE